MPREGSWDTDPSSTECSRREFSAMPARVTERARVFSRKRELLYCVKSSTNKDWARLVPAAAVIPAVQVVATFTGSKTFVARRESFLWNAVSQGRRVQEILPGLRPEGVRGRAEVVVKYFNLSSTNNGEGILLGRFWRWGMKARGAKRIRYPCSPSSKRCILNFVISSRDCGAVRKL